MARVAVDHSHTDGNNRVTGHRFPLQRNTTAKSPTGATPNHPFTANEQNSLPTQTTWSSPSPKNTQKKQVSTIQRHIHKQLYNNFAYISVERAILLSRSTSHTGAHLIQPSSEAYDAEDRCFRVSVARRLMLPHPAAPNATDVVQSCPNKSAAGLICNKPVHTQQHQCCGCRYGGGADRRHATVARCLADVIQSHSGAKVFIEQEIPALTRVVNGPLSMRAWISSSTFTAQSHFWMSPLLLLSLATQPWSQQPAQNHDSWPNAEKKTFDRYPHIDLVPVILETTGRPGPHARKFISYLMRDADNPPPAIRDTWSAIQSVLHSAISKQQLTAAVT